MTPWSHGYNTDVPYTFGYYRETDPRWLDFAALIKGFWPPMPQGDEPLRYLDLGCGQGFGLCLTAALHPEMEFVGIDFNPTHIAHAQGLAHRAGLANVRFIEGDFVELGRTWPAELGHFDYVVLHGIWSWIALPVRQGAVAAINRCLRPGGLVYNSYNAQPGWHAGSILRELLMATTRASRDQSQLNALGRALALAKELKKANAAVFQAYPGLAQRLERLTGQNLHYVANEYINEAHFIFWGHEVAGEMAPAKLTYIASANLPENFLPALLAESQAKLIARFTDPALQQLLIDLTINQSFRRDLYQRGPTQQTPAQQRHRLLATPVIGLRSEQREAKFATSFGQVVGQPEMYEPLQELADSGPITLKEILERHPVKPPLPRLIQAIAVTLWDNRLALGQTTQPAATVRSFNRAVLKSLREERAYTWLATPATCQGLITSPLEGLLLAAVELDGLSLADTDTLLATVRRDAQQLNIRLTREGKELTSQDWQWFDELTQQVRQLLDKKEALWAHLGLL